jgi:hypothetical protein
MTYEYSAFLSREGLMLMIFGLIQIIFAVERVGIDLIPLRLQNKRIASQQKMCV